MSSKISPLASIEPRLRTLLPADLYANAWVDPSFETLTRVFEHLRTLQRILRDYVPRNVSELAVHPGITRYEWQAGTLMFADLAGFTRIVEANAAAGNEGAQVLLQVLNAYFAQMIEVISKSGGDLLEFTGDALLVQFPAEKNHGDTIRAVRAGLRMQRAMTRFARIETPQGIFSFQIRIGIHAGRFLTADIGTPLRMEHVLLGHAVSQTKQTEGDGQVSRVCLTLFARDRTQNQFRYEPWKPGYCLVVDDLTNEQLGEYDLIPPSRRPASQVLMDRSIETLVAEIENAVSRIEPLASYLSMDVLDLIVESAARRKIQPAFVTPTVIFVNLIGLDTALERAEPSAEASLVAFFSQAVALINATVEARGGVLKKVTYHLDGSDMVIYFGVPNSHTDDPLRAAHAALAIRDIIQRLKPPTISGQPITPSCQIGMARGPAFAGEIGEPHGRREFNVLGDTVNTAARLMHRAGSNQIVMTEKVQQEIVTHFECQSLGSVSLKGKTAPVSIFALLKPIDPQPSITEHGKIKT